MAVAENKMNGFVPIYRSLQDHWIWQEPEKLKWWIDILLECNHSLKKVYIKGELIECKRGQSLYSLKTWAERWRCDVGRVRRFMKLLEVDRMIVRENVTKTTRITVCNYDDYNDLRQVNKSKTNGKRIPDESQANTNNHYNHYNHESGAAAPPSETGKKVSKSNYKQLTREEFIASLAAFKDQYPREMLLAFINYWKEPSPTGVMRFQLERTWETAGRLKNWKRRDDEQERKTGFQKTGAVNGQAVEAMTDAKNAEFLNNLPSRNNESIEN